MASSTLYIYCKGADKARKREMVSIRKDMVARIAKLTAERDALLANMPASLDAEYFRKLNLLNQHLNIANDRLRGKWMYEQHPQSNEQKVSKKV